MTLQWNWVGFKVCPSPNLSGTLILDLSLYEPQIYNVGFFLWLLEGAEE